MSGGRINLHHVSDLASSGYSTKQFLKAGRLQIGGKEYKVQLSTQGDIQVTREQHGATKMNRFFQASKDMFQHRAAFGSIESRSDQISHYLNTLKKHEDVRAQKQALYRAYEQESKVQRQKVAGGTTASQQSRPAQAKPQVPHQPKLETSAEFERRATRFSSLYEEDDKPVVTQADYDKYVDDFARKQTPRPKTTQSAPSSTKTQSNQKPHASSPQSGQPARAGRYTPPRPQSFSSYVQSMHDEADYYGVARPKVSTADYKKYVNRFEDEHARPAASARMRPKARPESAAAEEARWKASLPKVKHAMSFDAFKDYTLNHPYQLAFDAGREQQSETKWRKDYESYLNDLQATREAK